MKESENKKQQIKGVAFKLFLEKGYEASTVRMICKEARIEAPTLYYYFKSKKGLFFEVVADMLNTYEELLEQMIAKGECSAPEKLKTFFKFSVNYVLTYREETKFYLRYRLFIPDELKSFIEMHFKNTGARKTNILIDALRFFTHENSQDLTLETLYQRYINFIDSCTFNVIFSDWLPDDKELERIWALFCEYQLKQN